MVGLYIAIVIAVAIITAVSIICFKGIKLTYDKKFTVDDKRVSNIPAEEIQRIESEINNLKKANINTNESDDPVIGPMDGVIAHLQDLFGPENKE